MSCIKKKNCTVVIAVILLLIVKDEVSGDPVKQVYSFMKVSHHFSLHNEFLS